MIWIFLIIVLAIILISTIVYFIFRKKNQKSNLFDNSNGSQNLSLKMISGVLKALLNFQKSENTEGVKEANPGEIFGDKSLIYDKSKEEIESSKTNIEEGKTSGKSVDSSNLEDKETKQDKKRIKNPRNKKETADSENNENDSDKKTLKKDIVDRKNSSSTNSTNLSTLNLKDKKFVHPVEFIENIKGTELGKIIDSLNKQDKEIINQKISLGKFYTPEEFMDYLISELTNLLEEGFKELKNRISSLRKKGVNLENLEFKSMSIPLKIKVFTSTINQKDFEVVIKIMREMDSYLTEKESAPENKKES